MAKSKSYFGLRRGSTKTQTYSVLNGQQITKDRVEGGRNPRTPEQMAQRMCMATASAAYAAMKQIVDHSFEGVTYGGQTMAEFIRVNAAAIRQNMLDGGDRFAYNYYRDRNVYPGQYIMSRGSATPIIMVDNGYGVFGVSSTTGTKPSIRVNFTAATGSGDDNPAMTSNNIMAAMGMAVGDMATTCFLYPALNMEGYGFAFIRLRILKEGDTVITEDNYGDYLQFESNVPIEVRVVEGLIICETVGLQADKNFPVASCVIHSKKVANGWLRSSEVLTLPASMDVTPAAEDALASYPVGPSYVLNGGQV